jgi:hypothetical protein
MLGHPLAALIIEVAVEVRRQADLGMAQGPGRRALAGQHPENTTELRDWLAATVRGWNKAPTPFEWGGKRAARRDRAYRRRHALGGSGGCTRRPLGHSSQHPSTNRYHHAN